jgi:hypothetical protein
MGDNAFMKKLLSKLKNAWVLLFMFLTLIAPYTAAAKRATSRTLNL